MFDLCGRQVRNICTYCVIYKRDASLHDDSTPHTDYVVHRVYPSQTPTTYVSRILEFGFNCCEARNSSEKFVLVFTNADGELEFVFCLKINVNAIICISSPLPWFACFHGLLDLLSHHELYRDKRWHILHPYLQKLTTTQPPPSLITTINLPDPFKSTRTIRYTIPSPKSPHNTHYVMEYYNALGLNCWIHIFVCLLLERNVLFFSKFISRLTACVFTAVSLLYPLKWVNSLYPLIPTKLLEVLGSPVPFVAGIHSCNLQVALEHLSAGTYLVDLDAGTICQSEYTDVLTTPIQEQVITPRAVFHFLRSYLDDVEKNLQHAMKATYTTNKLSKWKNVNGEASSVMQELTQPFYLLIVNLLGCYSDCIRMQGGMQEVDMSALATSQYCHALEPFMRSLCETQSVQLFLDERVRDRPDPKVDIFEATRMAFYHETPLTKQHHFRSLTMLTAGMSLSSGTSGFLKSDMPWEKQQQQEAIVDRKSRKKFGSKPWLRSKKIRNPGDPCRWTAEAELRPISIQQPVVRPQTCPTICSPDTTLSNSCQTKLERPQTEYGRPSCRYPFTYNKYSNSYSTLNLPTESSMNITPTFPNNLPQLSPGMQTASARFGSGILSAHSQNKPKPLRPPPVGINRSGLTSSARHARVPPSIANALDPSTASNSRTVPRSSTLAHPKQPPPSRQSNDPMNRSSASKYNRHPNVASTTRNAVGTQKHNAGYRNAPPKSVPPRPPPLTQKFFNQSSVDKPIQLAWTSQPHAPQPNGKPPSTTTKPQIIANHVTDQKPNTNNNPSVNQSTKSTKPFQSKPIFTSIRRHSAWRNTRYRSLDVIPPARLTTIANRLACSWANLATGDADMNAPFHSSKPAAVEVKLDRKHATFTAGSSAPDTIPKCKLRRARTTSYRKIQHCVLDEQNSNSHSTRMRVPIATFE